MTQPVAYPLHTDEALAVYLEPHAEGRRVLLLGEAEGELGARLGRAAERLEIIDPRGRVPSDGEVPELPFRDGVFDLVVVVDVSFLPDPRTDAVRELRRVMRDDGILVLGGSATGGSNRKRRGSLQTAIDRLLGAEFRFVRVIGQAALSGFSFGAHDAPRDDDFSVDSSLVRGLRERAQRFIGFGSDVRLDLEARLWVQVPASDAESSPVAPSAELMLELKRVEDEARTALHRESELLREVEGLRRDQAQAERALERAKVLERKLTEIEGDYDDAVARVRFLEHELLERDAAEERDRTQQEQRERALADAKKALADAEAKRALAEQAHEAGRQELTALSDECRALEARLVEAGELSLTASREKKHAETVARDLLEELRTRERAEHVAVEHDARVSELEAERERAVQRALEAELARESASMRADELRAQLGATVYHAVPDREAADRARGELTGLRLRVAEAEAALDARQSSRSEDYRGGSASPRPHDEELVRARDRIDELEALVERLQAKAEDADRVVDLEAELDRLDHRVRELTRELEEADRFAEAHAEDAERIDTFDAELEAARRRLDSLEDELRATQDELRAARSDADSVAVETSARIELAQRRELDARNERDDARAALAEARTILAQLAGGQPGGDVQVGSQGSEQHLRNELAERDARLAAAERELAANAQRILQLEENLRAQIRGSVPPPFGSSEG